MTDSLDEAEKKRTDYFVLWIALAVLSVLLIFTIVGDQDTGIAASCYIVGILVAARLRWKLRGFPWFWITIAGVMVLHVPLLLYVHIPTDLGRVSLVPIAFMSFLITTGFIKIAEKLNGTTKDETIEDEQGS